LVVTNGSAAIDIQRWLDGTTLKLSVADGGHLTFEDGVNIVGGTSSGTKIGTATSQLFGFYNATPIVQPANTVNIDDVLVNLGLRATGGTAGWSTSLLPRAGTTTAGTAPIKFTSGSLLTAAEAGAMEFLTDAYYVTTTTGTVRRMVVAGSTGRATGQTAANSNVHTYTLGATDASYEVSANVLVTTSSAEAFTVTVDYTDEGNTARTATLNFQILSGTVGTGIAFANGAVPYGGIPLHIRCKASTTIVFKTTGTFTGCTYSVEGVARQLA